MIAKTRFTVAVAVTGTAVSFSLAGDFGPSHLDVVRRYADTMIEDVRDVYGPQKTPMMLSAFDRIEMKPLTTRPASPGGVRRGDRSGSPWQPLLGSNPHLDENLLRLLYTLTEVTKDERYSKAADDELKWFLNNAQSPVTGLLAWGEHLSWNCVEDKVISGGVDRIHEFARPWVLWDRCYELAPEPCKRFALGIWEHQIADHSTGGFDRHAPFDTHGPRDGKDFARHAGFYIQTWGYAYKHTRDEVFLKAIDVMVDRYEEKRKKMGESMVATIGAVDVTTASTMVPDPLAAKLKAFAEREDELMIAGARKNHCDENGEWSFEPTWRAGYSYGVLASRAMGCLGRYLQVGKPAYREQVVAIADAYRGTRPTEDVDVWPMSFGQVISTELAAYRFTGRQVYLDEAKRFGDLAVATFWQDRPLPRASLKTDHYEAITGADSLALSLLDLHTVLNSIEVEVPANVIDR